jgi:hypothetical protein
VHQMLVGLEKAGLISRQPRTPRSIRLLVEPGALPELRPAHQQPVKTSVQGFLEHFRPDWNQKGLPKRVRSVIRRLPVAITRRWLCFGSAGSLIPRI